MEDPVETPRLLARFKLQVRRLLDQSVDLERLVRDSDYARARLAEIEEAAEDEELLVMVLRLRDILCPRPLAPREAEVPVAVRSYRFGARSW